MRPWSIAHRGASADCPENTVAAFDEALRQGCDGLELDLQLTRDGVPVVYHDRTLVKLGCGRKRVAELALGELLELDAGSWKDAVFQAERVPTLDAVLERYGRNRLLLLEFKTDPDDEPDARVELVRQTVRAVRARRPDAVYLLCFEPDVLQASERLAPSLPRVWNLRPPPLMTRSVERRLAGLAALSVDISRLTRAFARRVAARELPLLTYTCNTARQVNRALGAGARGIMSDRPGWLLERLESEPSGP